jgi:hypothetical protein
MEKKGDVITMKKRNRLFAILLAMAMVLSLMPSLAFAGEPGAKTWSLTTDYVKYNFADQPVQLWVPITGDYASAGITCKWYFWNSVTHESTPIAGTGLSNIVSEKGWYECYVEDKYGNTDFVKFRVWYEFHEMKWGGFYFWNEDLTHAGAEGDYDQLGNRTPVGAVTIPQTVTLDDGKFYTVTYIGDFSYNLQMTSVVLPETATEIEAGAFVETGLTSITIPASVTKIGKHAVGYKYGKDAKGVSAIVLVPNFVIFGKTGSAAHAYAINNGIAFRDPEAEAIAAWNGTPDPSIAKAKASKPKAAKKSFTVKWKKLSKKQLKKGGVTNYEVQYSLNKSFPMNETTTKFVSKKKSSYKAKKLKSKKTYYVRVRAIRNVSGVKYVGSWSTQKVKVK